MASVDDVLAVAQAQADELPAGYAHADDPDVLTDGEGRIIGLRNTDIDPLTGELRDEPPANPPTKVVTDEEPRLWPEIRMMIETGIREQPRERQSEIGPSELGTDCLHCLAAKLAGWPQKRKPSWLPFIGTCVHEHFEQEFKGIQTVERMEPDELTGEPRKTIRPRFETEMRVKVGTLSGIYGASKLHGSIDLYDRKTGSTVDWKITGDTTMKAAKAHGPSQQYRVQASLYGIGLENAGERCERNCVFMLPRSKASLDEAYAWEVPFDPKPGQWAMGRAQLLINLMDCIELADGLDVRDAWIHSLPTSPTHCFQCGSWPDDQLGELAALNDNQYPDVPAKWETLKQLLEPTYSNFKD